MKTKKMTNVARELGIVIVIVAMMIVFSIGSDSFFTYGNIISIFQQASIKGIMAMGMTLIIVLGGIDLSAGAILGLSAMVAATIMTKNGNSIIAALIIGMLVGIACGLFNGWLISEFKLQPFLVTMGALSLFRGIDYIYSGAIPVRNLPSSFLNFMNSMNLSVPIPVIVLIGVTVIIFLITKFTKYGRYVFAIGGNDEAVRLSGINIKRVKIITYVIASITFVIAGYMYLGRLAAADPNMGDGYELDAIAAAAIGGASMSGGKGNVWGSLLGAFMIAMLSNGLTLLNVQSFYQKAATGLIIVAAVLVDKLSNKEE